MPIAIELAHPNTHASHPELRASEGIVYTRQALSSEPGAALWLLAKGMFRTLDSAVHQAVSHWMRCHACTEPYYLALLRCMSDMHPVRALI